MPQNKLSDLNNHLFAQIERLGDEELTKEEIEVETKRAKAITGVSSQIIKNAKVTIDTMKLIANGDFVKSEIPEQIGIK